MNRTLKIGLMLLFLLPVPAGALGRMYTLLELAQQSDLVFTGKVTAVDEKSATIEIDKVISGQFTGKTIAVTPSKASTDVGPYVNFKAGEAVLIFTKKNGEGEPATVVGQGQGKRLLAEPTRAADLAAAARMIEISALKEEDAINRAMLAEATSENLSLRKDACLYISGRISDSKLRENYAKELIALLNDKDPQVQRAGLTALRFIQAEIAIARMIELTRSEEAGVADSASLALGRYRTPESTAALVALTQSPNPNLRARALLDLGNNSHENVKDVLAAALDDKEPRVRDIAMVALIGLVRAGKADDLIPRIAKMTDDADPETVRSAIRALGETRSPQAIAPLLAVLQREKLAVQLKSNAIQSLRMHYSDPDVRPLVDARMDLIIAALKEDTTPSGSGPGFQAVGILSLCKLPAAQTALEWAAESHPNADAKDYARRILGKNTGG